MTRLFGGICFFVVALVCLAYALADHQVLDISYVYGKF